MTLSIAKPLALAACLIFSFNTAMAESQAERRSEQIINKRVLAIKHHIAVLHDSQRNASSHQDIDYKLKYTSGSERKDFPHLTAQQRMRLVFGAN